jgi:hypothetical protein
MFLKVAARTSGVTTWLLRRMFSRNSSSVRVLFMQACPSIVTFLGASFTFTVFFSHSTIFVSLTKSSFSLKNALKNIGQIV